jgi:hypothetical protein
MLHQVEGAAKVSRREFNPATVGSAGPYTLRRAQLSERRSRISADLTLGIWQHDEYSAEGPQLGQVHFQTHGRLGQQWP